MQKFKIRVLLAMLTVVFMLGTTVNCYAYDSNKDFSTTDISAWNQAKFPDSSTRKLACGNGDTVSAGGCSYFSIAYLLAKGGYIDPAKTSPINIIDKVESYKGWDTSWGHFDGKQIDKLEPDLKSYKYMYSLEGMSNEEVWTVLKDFYTKGYYLQVDIQTTIKVDNLSTMQGHYIFIDGWDNSGECIIGDSGRPGMKWSDYYEKAGTRFKYVNVYESVSGNACNKRDSIYSDVSLNKDIEMSKKDKAVMERLKSEWELVGMPKSFKLSDAVNDVPLPGELSIAEQNKVVEIKDNMNVNKMKWYDYAHIGLSFLGLCVILYGVLLGVAYLFDKSNNFIDLRLLYILTLGKCEVWNESLGVSPGRGVSGTMYCDNRYIIRVIVVTEVIGFLIISGKILSLIGDIITRTSSLFF